MKVEIPAGEFKKKCLRILDEVAQSRKEVTITKRGRPVARLIPAHSNTQPLLGRMKGSVEVHGDIIASVGEDWDADR
ncbi:MAG: type II toxin-antitoxin system Phd/YefM family antitoxin [Bryobacteraceae bacterium]